MTEQEWLACTEPQQMLEFLRGRAIDRKLRLFACACCRHVWQALLREEQEMILRVELCLEPREDLENLRRQWQRYRAERELDADPDALDTDEDRVSGFLVSAHAYDSAREASETMLQLKGQEIVSEAIRRRKPARGPGLDAFRAESDAMHAYIDTAAEAEKAWQGRTLADVFCNPFRPTNVSPAWLTPDVLSLTRTAYEERDLPSGTLDNARLAVLADALEDAGCTDQAILDHCRSGGDHYRGCWPIDLILGRE